ncbi:MAG TPA: helix-turn-helix domain-containing protein [Vicinamibacterales bacterium]|nr:helix-turn-helix domain-containing protein [Vicinamibacterales bacterium]
MPAVSETALARHHDDGLASAPRTLTSAPTRAEREAAAIELRRAFCEELRAARESRGVSLLRIAEVTKVSESLFAELERGHLSRWPTGIYRRAFFREYAVHVGLPAESTLSEFIRLFPEDRDSDTSRDALVPGPLRLTMPRPTWRQLSTIYFQTAVLDLVIVLLGSGALSWLTAVGPWISIAIVALGYHATGTIVLGCSPVAWWARGRLHRKLDKQPARPINLFPQDE